MTLARAFTALTGASAVSMAAQLVRGKLAALVLGPAGVGVFNQLSLMWNLFTLGGSLGATNGIIQHGAEAMGADDDPALRRLVSTSTLLLVSFAVLLAAAGVAASAVISDLLLHDGGAHGDLVALILLSVPLAVTSMIYRALLSASRAVKQLVWTQIISDVGGAIVFAALIVPLGLTGAVLGFMATHFLALLANLRSARKLLGGAALRPRAADFSWVTVRSNLGFGASGLIMVALSNLSVLFVSTLVIARLGLDANGFFANAWRIASVYLGAVTAATINYYLPTLTRCADHAAMGREVNATLRFYLFLLPPLMAVIMTGGELIVWLILSSEFMPVAALLLIFVPAELIRIIAETLSVPFLARRRVLPFTLLYILQAGVFVASAAALLPRYGLVGAALAYALSTSAGAIATFGAARHGFKIGLEGPTVATLARAVALLAAVGAISAWYPLGVSRIALSSAAGALWAALSLADPTARRSFLGLIRKLGPERG